MLSVDHIFVKDYTCVVLIGNLCSQGKKSKYLIETHYLTELLTLYRVRDFCNPEKLKAERKNIMSLRPQNAKRYV